MHSIGHLEDIARKLIVSACAVLGCACAGVPEASGQRPADAAINARFQSVLAELIQADPEIPAAVAVVRSSRLGINFIGAVAGPRETVESVPLADRPFRLASVTKVFTAAAILRLVETGRVDLDAPIARYIPEDTRALLVSDNYDPEAITVAHLLGHASGIADHAEDAYVAAVLAEPQHRWTPHEQIAFGMQHTDPLGRPGQAFHYSDTGYVILGQIIERQSGQPYAQAIRNLLHLDRLGLRATWYESLEPPPTQAPPLHQYIGAVDATRFDPSLDLWGGGGVIATADDLAIFMRATLRGELFDRPETLATALTVPRMEDQASGDAHNLLLFRQAFGRRTCYGHSGFWGVIAVYCPADDLVVVAAVNDAAKGGELFALLNQLATIVESAELANR